MGGRTAGGVAAAFTVVSSPAPDEPDVHLCATLQGIQFHFTACLTAALVFVQEQRHHCYFDTVRVVSGSTAGLRRMANERLFLLP
ncbi:hypothetical protein [Nocardia sp. CA-290969]|uniref:hypothetical protein n=1 Tax=Nocardia sp. CA-290969 TaxID=3239986 RepID=UPI003D91497A